MPEKFMPIIDNVQIIPPEGERLSPAEKQNKIEKRENRDSLSNFILKWWKGDAHSHSKESTREGFGYAEGIYDLKEMIKYYKQLGLEFVCFSEHASKPGTPEKQSIDSEISQSLLKQAERITEINKESIGDFVALSGVETNVFFDPSGKTTLDLKDEILEKLDLVIGSRHCVSADEKIHALKEKDPQSIKESLLFAVKDGKVDVIGHMDRYTRNDKEKSSEYWEEYWNIWPEILQEMACNNVAFEINLNNLPSKKLIEMATKTGVKFFINYDAHDFNQYKKEQTELTKKGETAKQKWAKEEISEEEVKILEEYKINRLSNGPGVRAILKLVRWIKKLESLGIMPERVVNSSRDNLVNFLTEDRKKTTENLKNLRKV